jgi:hypothetical protein
MADVEVLETGDVRDELSAIGENLENEVDLLLTDILEPIGVLAEQLESRVARRILKSGEKLRQILAKHAEKLAGCSSDLEEHDKAIQAAFEELIEEEEGT